MNGAPAGADLLGRAGHPAAVAVAAVHQQRAGGVAREDVGLAVAAEVAGREQRGERAPAAADGLASAGGQAAGAVAAVHQQARRRRSRTRMSGLPSPLKSPGARNAVNEPQPLPIGVRDVRRPAARAVAAVHQQPAVGMHRQDVAGPVAAEIGARGARRDQQGEAAMPRDQRFDFLQHDEAEDSPSAAQQRQLRRACCSAVRAPSATQRATASSSSASARPGLAERAPEAGLEAGDRPEEEREPDLRALLAVGRELRGELRHRVARVERDRRLGEHAHRREPEPVAADRREVVGGERVELLARPLDVDPPRA